MIKATLRLFHAVQVDSKHNRNIPQAVVERTVKNGYILDPSILPENDVLDVIERVIGISGDKANAAFHKSWSVIQNASMESLVMQQITHYITTYRFEHLGLYREDTVYIPREVLNLPDISEDIPLVTVKAMDKDEILERIIRLGAGIALAQETLDDIMTIIKCNKYDDAFVEKIGNRELKALLYDFYGRVPSDPVEFLRHLISKLTDESLLIKNDALIEKIKNANGKFLDTLLKDAPDNLASIFFRFKPLFLAMKSISNNKTFFNRLRKKADKLHVPVPEDYLNSITSRIKHKNLHPDRFVQEIEKAGIFRKIRLAYALAYRLGSENSIVYRVRNGRGWATDFNWDNDLKQDTRQALNIVSASIAESIRENVDGKTIFIPENVHYALPATEKQFTGHLPTGSWVSVPDDLIVGIHWTNTERRRIDLDLSVIGVSGKIGWDARYRSNERNILFSGDVTDAPPPHGASELFYIKKGLSEPKILIANYFNFQADDPVDCKIITAHENPKKFGNNYMIDVNNIISAANIKISKKESILGLIINMASWRTVEKSQVDNGNSAGCKAIFRKFGLFAKPSNSNDENRVYFANVSIGNSITSSQNENSLHARNYLIGSAVNAISFRKILRMAGATVVDKIPDGDFLNLSPEMLNKETLLDLINPQKSKAHSGDADLSASRN